MKKLLIKYHNKMIGYWANQFILGKNNLNTTVDKMCYHFDKLILMRVREELKNNDN